MIIPKSFCIAGGKKIDVELVNELDDYGTFGNFSCVTSKIKLAKQVQSDGVTYDVSEEDMERTFLHELCHCMNYYYNCESGEEFAQVFSNFLYEYLKTKQ